MRHRHLILAIRAEQAVSGADWVATSAAAKRALDAFGGLSTAEETALEKNSVSEKRVRDAMEMIRDLALDGTFLELRTQDGSTNLQCRLNKNGQNMASNLMRT